MAESGLHIRGKLAVGDCRGNHAAVEKRSDQHRHRRQLSRRGAVSHVELWLERGTGPRFWRELVAAAIAPPVGFIASLSASASAAYFPAMIPSITARYKRASFPRPRIAATARSRSSATKASWSLLWTTVCPASPATPTIALSTTSVFRRHRLRSVSKASRRANGCAPEWIRGRVRGAAPVG